LVGAFTAEDIHGYYERLANEPWMRPGMRFLADSHALSDVPPNRKFAGAALAVVRRAFSLRSDSIDWPTTGDNPRKRLASDTALGNPNLWCIRCHIIMPGR